MTLLDMKTHEVVTRFSVPENKEAEKLGFGKKRWLREAQTRLGNTNLAIGTAAKALSPTHLIIKAE
jgi:hypothetical protein